MKSIVWTLTGVASLLSAMSLAFAAGGCTSSSLTSHCTPTPCGNGGTLNVCTKNDSSGKCSEAGYEVGSQTFYCASCGDCTEAASQAAQACAALPAEDGGGSSSGGEAGSGGNCSAKTACGTTGVTYEQCTTLGVDGTCASIDYQTSDGHKFACAACTSCEAAAQELSQYCADPGSGGVTTCAAGIGCGTGGLTYQQCTTTSAGACSSMSYKVSDGQTYTCAGCNDCSAAYDQVQSFCASQGNPTTSCTSPISCGSNGETYSECTTSNGSACASIEYQATTGVSYTCASCTDCTTAYDDMVNYCNSLETPTTSCGTAYACGSSGATYYECTTDLGSTCESINYETSTGEVYDCNSCSDCTSAYDSVVSYCDTLGTTGGTCGSVTCGSAATCCDCSGTMTCYTLSAGETCATIGCQ